MQPKKMILEIDEPGSCSSCRFGHEVVSKRGYRISCGAMYRRWTDRIIGRALYCPLKYKEGEDDAE